MSVQKHLTYDSLAAWAEGEKLPQDWTKHPDETQRKLWWKQYAELRESLWMRHIATLTEDEQQEFTSGTHPSLSHKFRDRAQPFTGYLKDELARLGYVAEVDLGFYHLDRIVLSATLDRTPPGRGRGVPWLFRGFEIKYRFPDTDAHDAAKLDEVRSARLGTFNEYGNTSRVISRVAVAGMWLGLLILVAGIIGGMLEGSLVWERFRWVLVVSFVPLITLVIAVTPTVLFHIRITDGRVQHIFAGRRVLSDYPLQDFLFIRRFQSCCAAVLHFHNGGRIRFFGAHLGEIARLERDLKKLRNE